MIKVRLLNRSFMIEKSELSHYEALGYVKVDTSKEAKILKKIADRKLDEAEKLAKQNKLFLEVVKK